MAKEKKAPGYIEELDIHYRPPTLEDFSTFQEWAMSLPENQRTNEVRVFVFLLALLGDKEIEYETFVKEHSWDMIKVLRSHLAHFLTDLQG